MLFVRARFTPISPVRYCYCHAAEDTGAETCLITFPRPQSQSLVAVGCEPGSVARSVRGASARQTQEAQGAGSETQRLERISA